MDENIRRVTQIYQKHQIMNQVGICCSDEQPCDLLILFNEIKRLNEQVMALNNIINGHLAELKTIMKDSAFAPKN